MKNLSEREILQHAAESHLGQGIKRLTFRRLLCLQDFRRNGELIYEKGKTYKLWVVRYVDYILEIAKDFTAMPHEDREDFPGFNFWYAVPQGTFEDYRTAPKTYCWTAADGTEYRLITDLRDGTQCLIPEWRLSKKAVTEYVLRKLEGDTLLLQAVPRILWTDAPAVVWFIRQKLNKATRYFYMDVVSGEIHPWGDTKYSVLAPVSSNAKAIEAGQTSLRYRRKVLEYRF